MYESWSADSYSECKEEKNDTMSPNGIPLTWNDKGRSNVLGEKFPVTREHIVPPTYEEFTPLLPAALVNLSIIER